MVIADVPQSFGQLSISGTVCGIAQLGDEIFVACKSSRTIAVFAVLDGHENFTRRDDVSLSELRTPPQDITASDDYQRLFVADDGNQCVWQLDR